MYLFNGMNSFRDTHSPKVPTLPAVKYPTGYHILHENAQPCRLATKRTSFCAVYEVGLKVFQKDRQGCKR